MRSNHRVLIVLPTARLGGAERVMHSLISYLASEGHIVTVYALSKGMQLGWESLKARSNVTLLFNDSNSEKRGLFRFFLILKRITSKNPQDYVISSHTHINAALSLMKRVGFLKCSYLIGRESTVIFERFYGVKRKIFYAMYRFMYGSHDLLICQTNGMRRSLLDHLRFNPAREVVVLENPVNFSGILELSAAQVAAKRSGFNVVACGRLIKIKGFHRLVEALSILRGEGFDINLKIIGDGDERSRLQGMIEEKGLSDQISLLGHVANPIPFFKQADLGVICSEKEGFPNVLIEMMSAGTKNIVCTPCSDGVFNIPCVSVTTGFDAADLADFILKAAKDGSDNREAYREYIVKNRDVGMYWRRIVSFLA